LFRQLRELSGRRRIGVGFHQTLSLLFGAGKKGVPFNVGD
jgi:hypothetical protein